MSYKHKYSLSRRKMIGLSFTASSLMAAKLAYAEKPGLQSVQAQDIKDTSTITGYTIEPARKDRVLQSLQQALSQFQAVRDLNIDQLIEPAFTVQAKPYNGCE